MKNINRIFLLSAISAFCAFSFLACGKTEVKKQKVENCSELDGKEEECAKSEQNDGKGCTYVSGRCVADSAPTS